MKVENIDYGNLHIIEFDDNENLKDKLDKYHIGKNIYDIPENTIDEITKPNPKEIFIKQNSINACLYCDYDAGDDVVLTSTIIDSTKLGYTCLHQYDPEDLILDIINAEIEPKLPSCYYQRTGKTFIKRYIVEKVPDYFIHKQLFLEIVENPDQSYDLDALMPLYADLLPNRLINNGLSQFGINLRIKETIDALSDLF